MAQKMTDEIRKRLEDLGKEYDSINEIMYSAQKKILKLQREMTELRLKYREYEWKIGDWIIRGDFIGHILSITPVRPDHGYFELGCVGYERKFIDGVYDMVSADRVIDSDENIIKSLHNINEIRSKIAEIKDIAKQMRFHTRIIQEQEEERDSIVNKLLRRS